jgi:hypothetical protein
MPEKEKEKEPTSQADDQTTNSSTPPSKKDVWITKDFIKAHPEWLEHMKESL